MFSIVFNTDTIDGGGEHWFCIFIDLNKAGKVKCISIFDSQRPPESIKCMSTYQSKKIISSKEMAKCPDKL